MNNGAVIRQNRGDSTIGARIDLGDDTLNEHILRGMENVEERLRVELEKSPDFLQEKVMHLTKAGGKRFRPMFTLLASNYGPRPAPSRNAGQQGGTGFDTILNLIKGDHGG